MVSSVLPEHQLAGTSRYITVPWQASGSPYVHPGISLSRQIPVPLCVADPATRAVRCAVLQRPDRRLRDSQVAMEAFHGPIATMEDAFLVIEAARFV